MASVFGHSVLAAGLSTALPRDLRTTKVVLLGVLCSIIPDADVLAFKFGIPYDSMWGHRGITHSILVGLLFGLFIAFAFHFKKQGKQKWILGAYYSVCTISHGVLDALTTGGKGVAFFAPFDIDRYFLAYRLIQVSPIGASRFFSEWGVAVLKSEFFYIGIPTLIFIAIMYTSRKLFFSK